VTLIRRVAVFGAGVMGAGIAAHVANAGVPVLLFDVTVEVATAAVERLHKSEPAALMRAENAALIRPCGVDRDIAKIADCDWIVEAIVERADAKRSLYEKIEAARRPGSIVSSNTSTIKLAVLTDGLPPSLARDFLITHFFNPPRYMRLLEIAAGPQTRTDAVAAIERFADLSLGKTPVACKDTPGFIANRIGTYWLQCAVIRAMDKGLTVEEADAVLGVPMGAPKTGVFGLLDLIGLDLMPHVLASLAAALPKEDAFHEVHREPALIKDMIAAGNTGRKGKGGFYRLTADRTRQAIDLATGQYRALHRPSLQSLAASRRGGLRALLSHDDKGGRYAWWVLSRLLAYAARLVPEIADDIVAVDAAMRLGYNWKYGPFELIDRIGVDWFVQRLRAEAVAVPPRLQMAEARSFYRTQGGKRQFLDVSGGYRDLVRPAGVLLLADIKLGTRPVARNRSASLWDIGDGVLCLEFHSKMNSLNPLTLRLIDKAINLVPGRYRGLIIYNEGENFSVGANIGLLLVAQKLRAWFAVKLLQRYGQNVFTRLKYANFPVVGAPSGMALGGGCEVLLHCGAIQAHAETYTGLVEVGVGIIPGWGGCKELLLRHLARRAPPNGPMPPVIKTFETIAMASVAKSAERAKDMAFLRRSDGITMNRDRLLADAKAKVLQLSENYSPPAPPTFSLPGKTAFAALTLALDGFHRMARATDHDVTVGRALARVLSGGDTDVTKTLSESDLLALESRAFLDLARTRPTAARVAHMLKTGKPLRN
jgi:3-hydroxyacyl-CoA dehydrogenase